MKPIFGEGGNWIRTAFLASHLLKGRWQAIVNDLRTVLARASSFTRYPSGRRFFRGDHRRCPVLIEVGRRSMRL